MTAALTLQQRAKIVLFNIGHDGLYNGTGYPGHSPNEACAYFKVATTYSCAIGVSYAFAHEGPRLISMQPGWPTGYAYCPDGLNVTRERHAVIGSWRTQPADPIFINTGNGAQPGHTEMVIFRNSGKQLKQAIERRLAELGIHVTLEERDDVMYSFGWDSGPSNVDRFTGQGGCHLHRWSVPAGIGNATIMTAADASKLVVTAEEHATVTPGKPTRRATRKARKHGPKGQPLVKTHESKVTGRKIAGWPGWHCW